MSEFGPREGMFEVHTGEEPEYSDWFFDEDPRLFEASEVTGDNWRPSEISWDEAYLGERSDELLDDDSHFTELDPVSLTEEAENQPEDPEQSLESEIDYLLTRGAIEESLRFLNERHRLVIRLRFMLYPGAVQVATLEGAGKVIDVTRQRAKIIEATALSILRCKTNLREMIEVDDKPRELTHDNGVSSK